MSLLIILILLGSSLLFYPYTYDQQIRGEILSKPSLNHLIGTDDLGRDLFARLMVGLSISLIIAFIATIINLTFGVVYGTISGYVGKSVGLIMMRVTDVIYSIPEIIYLILILIFMKDYLNIGDVYGIGGIIITLSIAFWIPFARVLRNQILVIKNRDFINAAKGYGASHRRIIVKYILPNCIPIILITTVSRIPVAIFFESFLSFIGLGVEPPLPSLGGLLADGLGGMRSAPQMLLSPAFSIVIIILIFNIIADGLREVFDNKTI